MGNEIHFATQQVFKKQLSLDVLVEGGESVKGNQDINIAGRRSFPSRSRPEDSQRFHTETLELGEILLDDLKSSIEIYGCLELNYSR